MDPERLARYADKLDHAQQRLEAFEGWEAGPKAPLKVSMLVKDLGVPPKDNHANVDELEDRDVVTSESAQALHEIAGLRNRLVPRRGGRWTSADSITAWISACSRTCPATSREP